MATDQLEPAPAAPADAPAVASARRRPPRCTLDRALPAGDRHASSCCVAHARASAARATRTSCPAASCANLLIDNSFLIVLAVGMTFVILTGGIDLSVGAVVALSGDASRPRLLAARAGRRGVVDPAGAPHRHAARPARRRDGPLLRDPALHRHARRRCSWRAGLCYVDQRSSRSRSRDPTIVALASAPADARRRLVITPSGVIALVVVAIAFVRAALHPVRPHGLRDRRQRAARRCSWACRSRAPRCCVYVISGICAGLGGLLFALYIAVRATACTRRRHGARRHRRGRHRRHPADRRQRLRRSARCSACWCSA